MRPWRISFLLDSVRYHDDVKTTTTSKVRLVQSQDPDVRLILQIDIVMCLIYSIEGDVTPTSLKYQNVLWETVLNQHHLSLPMQIYTQNR